MPIDHCPLCLLLLSVALLLTGCGSSKYELAPVDGKLTIEGKPFGSGQVAFIPAAKPGQLETGKMSMGVLDEQGHFQLQTVGEGKGAMVGTHWVSLYSMSPRSNQADSWVPEFEKIQVNSTPVEVKAGEQNHFEFELSLDQFPKAKRRR